MQGVQSYRRHPYRRALADPPVVWQEGAARLIDPYDEEDIARALLEVGGSAQSRSQMRERGLARAQAFNWTETARRTLAVLNEIASRASPLK